MSNEMNLGNAEESISKKSDVGEPIRVLDPQGTDHLINQVHEFLNKKKKMKSKKWDNRRNKKLMNDLRLKYPDPKEAK